MTGTGSASCRAWARPYRRDMDNRAEVRDFLRSRRARLRPDEAGLPAYGGNRRVPGLRREEVAMLAGISGDYYIRLERGDLSGASESVLESLATALRLDAAERQHLRDLARAAQSTAARPRRRPATVVPTSVHAMLAATTGAPAFVRDDRLDILAANPLGRALYAPLFDTPGRPNHARFAFLDPRAGSSGSTGTGPPTTRSGCCARPPGGTPSTATSPPWSANCPPAARSSAAVGPPITSTCTRAGANGSVTPGSASWS